MRSALKPVPSAPSRWMRDPAAEALFERLGVKYEYRRDVEIALIDRDRSLRNQARVIDTLNNDVVESYALAMLEGAVFPALVAFPLPTGTYVLAGGNHRTAAAILADITLVDLYVLDVRDGALQRLITTTLNESVGHGIARPEKIELAIDWMERYGRTARSAAAEYHIPEAKFTDELRARAAQKRLLAAGVPAGSLNKSHAERLVTIPNDIVLRAAAALQIEVKLPDKELGRFVKEIRAFRTEGEQLGVVRQWREREDLKIRKTEVRRGRPSPSVRHRGDIFRGLKTVGRVLEQAVSLGATGLTGEHDYDEALKLARDLVARLEALGGDSQ